eukprot:12455735-Alexandrium_andersonii.AAC.1
MDVVRMTAERLHDVGEARCIQTLGLPASEGLFSASPARRGGSCLVSGRWRRQPNHERSRPDGGVGASRL